MTSRVPLFTLYAAFIALLTLTGVAAVQRHIVSRFMARMPGERHDWDFDYEDDGMFPPGATEPMTTVPPSTKPHPPKTHRPTHPPPTTAPPVPPLPYLSFSTWVVLTQTSVNAKGNATIDWSIGQHVNVLWEEQTRCRYDAQLLLPYVSNFSGVMIANYTSHIEDERWFSIVNGDAVNCSSRPTPEHSMQPGGAWYLAPHPALMRRMTFIGFVPCNQINCSAFQYVFTVPGTSLQRILTWTVSTDGGVPQMYTNVTKNLVTNEQSVLTSAFQGYHEAYYFNEACTQPFLCGPSVCVANPDADINTTLNGLMWACADGGVDCTNITAGGANFYPNTIIAHATFAFNEYYQANLVYASSSCDFGGTAEVEICDLNCTICQAMPNATDAALGNALNWVCGPNGIQNCEPIQPGGANFFPNTTHAHATWAFNVYYQAYKCIPQIESCGFGGVAEVVNC